MIKPNTTAHLQMNNQQTAAHPSFKPNISIETRENSDVTKFLIVHIDWDGTSRTPLVNFPRENLKKIGHRLYIWSPYVGGKVSPISIVYVYTDIFER